jgi:integrase
VLLRQRNISQREYVFVRESDRTEPASISALNRCHERVREQLGLPTEVVPHSLPYTLGTRLGEAGRDAFTIMRIMGHASITVSQRYLHPKPETMENAFVALELAAQEAEQQRSEPHTVGEAKKTRRVATILATLPSAVEQ